ALVRFRIGTVVWIRRTRLRHRLDHVGVVDTAAPRSTRLRSATSLTTCATTGHLKQRRLAEVDRQRGIVTISDRTLPIRERRVVKRSTRLKLVRRLNGNAAGKAIVDL